MKYLIAIAALLIPYSGWSQQPTSEELKANGDLKELEELHRMPGYAAPLSAKMDMAKMEFLKRYTPQMRLLSIAKQYNIEDIASYNTPPECADCGYKPEPRELEVLSWNKTTGEYRLRLTLVTRMNYKVRDNGSPSAGSYDKEYDEVTISITRWGTLTGKTFSDVAAILIRQHKTEHGEWQSVLPQ